MVVRHHASDGRPIPGHVHRLQRHISPPRASVEQVKLLVRGLDPGSMERLIATAGKQLRLGRPVTSGLPATVPKLGNRVGRINFDGPDDDIRYRHRGRTTSQLPKKGTAEVLLRLQRLVLDGPVQTLLSSNRGAAMGLQDSVH